VSATEFHEVQRLPRRRAAILVAIPPIGMLALLIWQVVLGHRWGKQPMSNASVIGWTIFLWIVYLRLMTVRLVTDIRGGKLVVAMRGLWRARRISLSEISKAEVASFDPERDYGGYGIRSNRQETAYLAAGNRGVRLTLSNGARIVVGSQRAEELADVLRRATAEASAASRKDKPVER
jgi:hypothetical protein